MRFGLFGSAQANGSDLAAGIGQGFHDYIDFNVEAEALGYHSTFLVEHHFTGWSQVSATLSLLTFLAARTRTLRLGTAVMVVPWHNPVLLAEQAATLDVLSGGRLDFGIGKGYRHREFTGFCIPSEQAEARFEEGLEVILKAWTSEGPFSHHGKFWNFENIVVEPAAAQRPRPAIWMAAGSEPSISKVERRGFNLLLDQFSGDGIMVFFNDPVPCPDPAERAVKMAMAMRETAGDLIAAWRRRGRELGFDAGIAQGYATLGQIGFAERSGYTAIGTVCNVAARLCAEAKDGQILLSQRVAVAVEGTTMLEELGALTLKGLTQPVVAYNVPLAASQPALRVIEGGPESI